MEPEIIRVAEARKSKVAGTPFKNRQYEPLTIAQPEGIRKTEIPSLKW